MNICRGVFSAIELKWHIHIWKVNLLLQEENTVAETVNKRAWLVSSVLTSILSCFFSKEVHWDAEYLKVCWVHNFRFPHLIFFFISKIKFSGYRFQALLFNWKLDIICFYLLMNSFNKTLYISTWKYMIYVEFAHLQYFSPPWWMSSSAHTYGCQMLWCSLFRKMLLSLPSDTVALWGENKRFSGSYMLSKYFQGMLFSMTSSAFEIISFQLCYSVRQSRIWKR